MNLKDIPAPIEKVQLYPAHMLKLPTAPSLKPGVAMMEAAATGQPEACAIRDAWAFNQPVKIVSRAEFDRMVAHQDSVTF